MKPACHAILCLLFSLVPAMASTLDNGVAARPPNIVLLYADDMGYGDLGVQNEESRIPTPHLDRMAEEGMRFTDSHSSSGICTPCRYALMTGRFHWRKFHGIVESFDPPVLDAAEFTLPEMLKEQGYRTACIGKWHLGWDWESILRPGAVLHRPPSGPRPAQSAADFDWSRPVPGGPLAHGFDYYFGDDVPNFPPYAWIENDRVVSSLENFRKITSETKEGGWEARLGPMARGWDFYAVGPAMLAAAEKWIEGQREQKDPFFLYVPFNSPHTPIVPSPEFSGSSGAGGYGDFMVQTDHLVGRILKALEDHGLTGNTLVIFTADNGPEHFAYERIRKFRHYSAGKFRGVKRDLYEGGHRVPFLVKWPGEIEAGAVCPHLFSQVDLMATIAAVTGAALPSGAAPDSYNFLPVWTGQGEGPRKEIVHNTHAGLYAVRKNQWVLVAHPSGSHSPVPAWYERENGYVKSTSAGELFDLEADPAQKINLYNREPGRVAELSMVLQRIRANGQVRSDAAPSAPPPPSIPPVQQ